MCAIGDNQHDVCERKGVSCVYQPVYCFPGRKETGLILNNNAGSVLNSGKYHPISRREMYPRVRQHPAKERKSSYA